MDMQFLGSNLSAEENTSDNLLFENLLAGASLENDSTNNMLEATKILELVNPEEATHIAQQNGSWFDNQTWQNGEIPGQNARVLIPEGITVSYAQKSAEPLFSLRVDGELSFASDTDTQMVIDTFVVSPTGSFNIGSDINPLQANVTATIVIADNGPIDTLWDPNQASRGVIALGEINLHSQPKTPFLTTQTVPAAGDLRLVLDTIPTDWQVGDTLVIAAPQEGRDRLDSEEESVTIQAIEGNQIILDQPLQFDHAPTASSLETYVANVSRNIVIETANAGRLPSHQRGHVLLSGSDAVDIRYAEFRELGRTDLSKPLDNSLIDQGDRTNIPGRYALHLNQVGNAAEGSPATLMGNSIVGSPGWGYVQANSHADLADNAVFDVIGSGFVAATDQERGTWANNIAIKAAAGYAEALAQPAIADAPADFWPQGEITSQGNISTQSPFSVTATPELALVESANNAITAIEPMVAAMEAPDALSPMAASATNIRDAEMWEFEEWDFNNPTYSGNPFDLKASVTFTHTKSGEKRTTNLFYDGDNEWSFRFTGDLEGEWTYKTSSSDQDLNGHTGKINVRPNDNPEIEGFLTSVGNKFAIQTKDANTLDGYLLNVYMNQADHFKQSEFEKWNPNRTAAYFQDAQNNGSEVLYFQINNNWFDFGSTKASDHDSRNPDERTFELLEDIITDVHQRGGRVHFWSWGDRARGWIPKDGVNSEADQRLQSYIAARLGPLPGWSMGYSFDTQEFTDDSDMEFWADNLLSQMGWDHLLFARGYAASDDVPVNDPTSKNDWVAENLSGHSYSSKGRYQEGLQTSPVSPANIEEVITDINTDTSKPHFYEERFTYNRSSVGSTSGTPNDMEHTRQLMWWQAMAGGVGGWFGFFDWSGNQSPPYSNPEQLRTHYTFWHEHDRFGLDLEQANNLADSSDTHLLKRSDNSQYIVYTENRDSVQVDLPKLTDGNKVIAVDTKKDYREIDLGEIAQGDNRKIDLPYRSDWAIVIGADDGSTATPIPTPPDDTNTPTEPTDPVEPPEVPDTPEVPDPPEVPATPPAPPSETPILQWTLDDGSGNTAQDASANDRDGTLRNGPSWTADGQLNGALNLNGNNQFVIDADAETYLNGLNAITIAMWVKSNQVGTDRGFISSVDQTGNDANLGIRYDDRGAFGGGDDVIKVGLRTTQGVVEYESASNVQTQDWQHVVLAWQSGEAPQLYIDGQLDTPTKAAPAIGGTLTGITDLLVGKGLRVADSWDGSIDDVRIYNRALDTTEVTGLFNATPAEPPTNEAPIAQADTYATTADQPLSISADQGVLGNDTDADGDNLSVTSTNVTSAAGGTVTLNDDGSFDYTPATDFVGNDTFEYTISDGQGGTDTAQVTVQVTAAEVPETPEVPDPPDTPETPVGAPILRWTLDDSSGNTAADASGQNRPGTLTNGGNWTSEGQLNGALGLNGNNQVVVDADAEDYLNGLDAITLSMWVKSDQVGTDRGFVSSVSTTGDDKDLGIRYDARGAFGGGKNVIKVGLRTTEGTVEYESAANVQTQEWQHVVLAWQSGQAPQLYIDGQLDTPTKAADAIGGTLSGVTDLIVGKGQRVAESWDGNIDDVRIYDRALNATEVAAIFNDDEALANQAPTAQADTYEATAGESLAIAAANGVLANDADADGNDLTVTTTDLTSAQGGSVELNSDGSFDYTPAADFVGSDTFEYSISDGQGGTDTAQVTVQVAAAAPPAEPETPDTPDMPDTPEPPDNPTGPNEDPILRWTMDAGTGNQTQDASGNNRTGDLTNGPSWTANGALEGALSFNGNNQLVLDADAETYLNGLDAVTLAMWVKSDQVGTDRGFLSGVSTTGSDDNLGIRYDDRGAFGGGDNVIKVGLRTTEGVVEYESAANVQTTDWQHVVLSWRSGEAPKLYINGELDTPTQAAPAIGGQLAGITDLIVGKGQRVAESWDGNIDDVRIYDRALAAAEIESIIGLSDIQPPSTPSDPLDPVNPAPLPPTDDDGSISSLDRKLRTKDLNALQEVYNVTFDKRGTPDVHIGMAASDVIMLKVQQNEFIGEARKSSDMVEEAFDHNLTKDNIEIIGPDGQVFKPTAVHRKSKVADSAKKYYDFIIDHYFHLELPADLDPDAEYTVRFKDGNLDTINFTPEDNVSLAIHNVRAYDSTASNKIAKLSSWMSKNGGGVEYEAGTPFRVIDEATGQVVHSGGITLDSSDDPMAGTDVYSMDFSAVAAPGTYRIEVEGIGKSLPFEIRANVWEDMLDLSMEGMYAHRAFAKLEQPYSDFERPANTQIVYYPSSVSEADFDYFDGGRRAEVLPETADRSKPTNLTGGWFDAGDYDTKSLHIETIMTFVDLFNSNPEYFERFNPNIPESGDQIPDVLNEAMWGMQLYKQIQNSDGGVSAGFEFDSHPSGTRSWEEKEAFIYAPDFRSSYRFASAAAMLSTALAPYDAEESADLQERAIRAFDWAEDDLAKRSQSFQDSGRADQYRQQAAVEMYRLTGEDDYHDVFRSINKTNNHKASFVYAQLDPNVYTAVDRDWQEKLRNKVIEEGDELVSLGEKNGFDTINDSSYDQNWGHNTVMTNKNGLFLSMAHQLTDDDKYLDALTASMQFTRGMNPDNLSFTTGSVEMGLAYDEVDDVLHDDGLAMDQIPDGITVYGFYGRNWFAWPTVNNATDNTIYNKDQWSLEVPFIEAFNDYHYLIPMTEYTIHQTIDDQVYVNGYLAGQASDRPSAERSHDSLTGMVKSMQWTGEADANDPLVNYANTLENTEPSGIDPSAGSFMELATTTNSDLEAIALTAIGSHTLEENNESTFKDDLTSVINGQSPLKMDVTPKPIAV